MSKKVTIPEMVALADSLAELYRQPMLEDYDAAVTAAGRLAKALAELAGKDGFSCVLLEPCGECSHCRATALLDDLYPNWREVL